MILHEENVVIIRQSLGADQQHGRYGKLHGCGCGPKTSRLSRTCPTKVVLVPHVDAHCTAMLLPLFHQILWRNW